MGTRLPARESLQNYGVCVCKRVSERMEKVMVKIIYTSIQLYSLSLHSNVSDNFA